MNQGGDVFGLRAGMIVTRDTTGVAKFEAVATQITTPSTHISKAVMQLSKEAGAIEGAAIS